MGQKNLVHGINQIPNHLSLKVGFRCASRTMTVYLGLQMFVL